MKNPSIAVVDLGVANIYNITKALARFKADVHVTVDAKDLEKSDAIVLPGVGAFGAGVEGLMRHRLMEPLRELSAAGKPILGICLGAQLLMSEGREFGVFKGLNIIPGVVEHFPNTLQGVKVPHIGWNALNKPSTNAWKDTPLASVPDNAYMYFNHSFFLNPENKEHVLAETTYGGFTYAAVIRKGNTYGAQFHPEKSADVGLAILENFIKLI